MRHKTTKEPRETEKIWFLKRGQLWKKTQTKNRSQIEIVSYLAAK